MANSNSLRIIGGAWRSRRIQFFDSPKIRPTPDRVRETLFNWLASNIEEATCLDLFAGSGALGFESASRGAEKVVMIEEDVEIASTLMQQQELLHAKAIEIKNQNALSYLKNITQRYDVIFLDPPFDSGLLDKVIPIIIEQKLLTSDGLLYIESAAKQEPIACLSELECVREKTNGDVRYALYKELTSQ